MRPRLRIHVALSAHSTAYGFSFLLPLRIEEIGGDEAYVGRILGIAMLSAIVSGILAGKLADMLGRSGAILVSALVLAVTLLLVAVIPEPGILGVLIGIGLGFGWAVYYFLGPILTVGVSPADQRVKVLTIVSALQMLGVGVGPALGRAMLSVEIGVQAIFCVAAGLACVSALLFLSLRRVDAIGQTGLTGRASLAFRDVGAVLRSNAGRAIVMVALSGSIFGCLTTYQTVIAAEKGIDFSIFFAVFVTTVVVGRIALAGAINARPPYPAATCLLVIMCVALACYAFVPRGALVFTVTTVAFAIGYGMTYPVLNGMAANIDRPELLQKALLIYPLSYFLGLYGFPFVGGWLIAEFGVFALLVVLFGIGCLELCCAIQGLWRTRVLGAPKTAPDGRSNE